ncbi:hypothetical protein HQ585_18695 [candidate division KSB1 bacterium]|nr:hypothetical protein [candidate division KSB1 bacterium]
MKTKIILLILSISILCSGCKKKSTNEPEPTGPPIQNEFIAEQLRTALEAYDLMRNGIGVYADAVKFDGNPVPCSVAAVGMGLVALCVADEAGYDTSAETKALQTIRAFSGLVTGFDPARNPVNGFFRHWIDMNTGERAWNSEYSSIDSGILLAGVLFCKSYFSGNSEIASLADSLYLSITWSDCIGSIQTGEIWMVFDEAGNGSLPAKPFNEYMITAWLAKNDIRDNTRATALWSAHYADPANLPKKTYEGFECITDGNHFLSNFVIQFPYYLCHPFTTSSDYIEYLSNAKDGDLKWWELNTTQPDYVWGTGAGPAVNGYHADSFDANPYKTCSPQILAGFLPIYPEGLDDLENLWNSGLGRYDLPGSDDQVLWRFSITRPDWTADGAAGVDWSTMVFGLAAHPEALGIDFFIQHNDFKFP